MKIEVDKLLKYKLPIKLTFSHYHKYTFYYGNSDDPNFKVRAWYGGDADRIYRHSVNNNEYVTVDEPEDFYKQFTGFDIHNYTNECIAFWEEEV